MASSTGAKGTVVVIDSGWSSAWPTGNLIYQQDFLNGDGDAKAALSNTHGALVTTDILKQAPDVGIIELKVLPDDGSSTGEATIEKAMQWVVANADAYNVVAVNLSLAGGSATVPTASSLSDEIAALAAKRVFTVAAAGNAGDGGATQDVSYFAADPSEICVSASTGAGQFPSWAQRSPTLTDLCADGTDVALTNLAGQTYLVGGSSFSAPAVTAAVALAQEEAVRLSGSRLSVDEFVALARSSGTPMADGYAELNTGALLSKITQTYSHAPASGSTTIVVNAQGNPAAGVNAHFNLLVDGVKVGSATAGTTAKDFAFTTTAAAGEGHKVQVQYDNDAYINGQDRSLIVNKLVIGGHAHAPTESIATYDKGALDGRDVVAGQSGLWWNGTLVFNAPAADFPAAAPPASAATAIVVNAQGNPAGGVNAHFNLLVDGVKVGSATADVAVKDFTFTTTAATGVGHKVQVQYDNDAVINAQDRSLMVNKITIGGHTVAPTDSIVTYDRGALDGRDVVAGQSGLWWNGTLVVSADKAWFPGTAAAAEVDPVLAHVLAPATPDAQAQSHDAVLAPLSLADGMVLSGSGVTEVGPYDGHLFHAGLSLA